MSHRSISFFIFTVFLAWSGSVFAQDESGASVVVLKLNAAGVDQEVTDLFYLELHEQIRAHSGMHVASSGEVTIQDLMLMAGCSEPTADCLGGLADFIEGDRVVFGGVTQADDAYTFNLSMFDFTQSRFVGDLKGFVLHGSSQEIQYKLPIAAEALLYGNVGTLEVKIDGRGAARIFVNDVDKGRAPLMLSDLPLGEVTVTAWGDDESEQVETVLLRRNQPGVVVFSMDAPSVVASKSSSNTPYLVSGIAAATVGVGGLVAAALGHFELDSLNSQASTMMVPGRPSVLTNNAGNAKQLQSDMDTAHTMRVVGVSVGAVGLVAGTFLLVKALTSDSSADVAPPVSTSQPVSGWRLAPSATGIGFSLGADF